jgi:hypothetical protein
MFDPQEETVARTLMIRADDLIELSQGPTYGLSGGNNQHSNCVHNLLQIDVPSTQMPS